MKQTTPQRLTPPAPVTVTAWILLLVLTTLVCSTVSAEPISVTDSQGRVIKLVTPARRIVALAPHLVENVYSAGAGDKLVGVVGYSDFPPAAQSLPIVGDFGTFSIERIAQLEPDLILMWGSGNGATAWERLQPLDIPVYVDEIRRLDDIPTSLRNIGKLAGTETLAEAAAREFESNIDALRSRYASSIAVSVFYQIWHEPLQTLGGEHLMNQIISLCGGNNVFADAPGLAPVVSIESLLVANPTAIIASGAGPDRPSWLDEWQKYPTLSAVHTQQIYYVDPDLIQRPTLRLIKGAEQVCLDLNKARQHALN
ncbi:MAG: cobalamin-binding protein [Halioglobus sp.]